MFANIFQAPSTGAVGGGMGGIPGMPDVNPEQMATMLENESMRTSMEQLLSDPAMVNQMIASNPSLQSLVAANPQMASMLQDPAMLRSFLQPDTMRSMMQMRAAMAGMPGMPTVPGAPAAGTPGAAPIADQIPGGAQAQFDFNSFAQMMNAMNGGGAGGVPGNVMPPRQPEAVLTQEQLAPQLAQLRDMGFLDTQMCLDALRQARGNVNVAIENLLSRFN
jgi:ubiquilin